MKRTVSHINSALRGLRPGLTILVFVWILSCVPGFATNCNAADGVSAISPDQRRQLKSLVIDIVGKTRRERNELRQARNDLRQYYRSYNVDERRVKVVLEKINKCQLTLLNLHLDNQIAVRRILTESQFPEFQDRVNKRMGHRKMEFAFGDESFFSRFPGFDVLNSIGISPDQIKKIQASLCWPQRKKLIEKLRQDSCQLLDINSQYNLNIATARKLISSIHNSQHAIALINYKSQLHLRSILNQGQFERLRDKMPKRFRDYPRRDRRY